ncbi:winged helix DNA-binding protein [Sphingomonas pokkalii]|uniref:Uncharacterized protein n=1 Tax=Sphingomonas pokkalii TaxID=2175090 RepID=A0A2U0SHY7_9SPHN|nr:winged helix DNA-binding protein [Sphingomonas pokkalii]PVX30957.1 hypothetical protein DD559_17810 [Sphingomonas pokkalii]
MGDLRRMSTLVRMLADEIHRAEDLFASDTSAAEIEQDLLPDTPAVQPIESLAKAARRYARLRQRRAALFTSDLFADPAWDILIDLFASEHEGRKVAVTSACLASAVPSTTALRWLSLLERERLVERVGDASDKRRSFVQLTRPAEESMAAWFGLMVAEWGSEGESPSGRRQA